MDVKEIKKILAGVGIAGLLTGMPIGGGVAFGGSGWGAKGDSAVGTEKSESATSGSGWGGKKESAVGTQEETKKNEKAVESEKKATDAPKEETKKSPTGGSGWSGSK